jgi:hypothetical protein
MPGHIETRQDRGQSIGTKALGNLTALPKQMADAADTWVNRIDTSLTSKGQVVNDKTSGKTAQQTGVGLTPGAGATASTNPGADSGVQSALRSQAELNAIGKQLITGIANIPPFINPSNTRSPVDLTPKGPIQGPVPSITSTNFGDSIAGLVGKGVSAGLVNLRTALAGLKQQQQSQNKQPTDIKPTPSALPTPTAPSNFVQPGTLASVQALAKGLGDVGTIGDHTSGQLSSLAQQGIAAITTQSAGATAATGLTQSALDVLGQTKATPTITQVGAEAVTGAAGITRGALESIPVSWFSSITQAGAEAVTGAAGITE